MTAEAENSMNVPHPIPYQGSKRSLAPIILSYFPANAERLIEPFAGSAAVSLLAGARNKAKEFVLNDLNQPLMILWEEIIQRPDAISRAYEELWIAQSGREREFYDEIRDRFNQTKRPDYFLYLLARCVKAAIRYNAEGEFNQSPDNRRKGARPDVMRTNIVRASRLLQGKALLSATDYQGVVLTARPSDIVYMDPPYQGVCGKRDPRYIGGFTFQAFVDTLHKLNDRLVSYIVSYDGRTGSKTFGEPLPAALGLTRTEIDAGRSSQATLLGRTANTYESLYLSPALANRLGAAPEAALRGQQKQLSLFETTP